MAKKKNQSADCLDRVAVVYARYSSHAQGEQSIEGQLDAARKYAALKGYKIVEEYIDRAITGRTDQRASFQQMIADSAKKKFGVVITWKVDRIGRNREEVTLNKYRLKQHGVHVEYVAESLPEGNEAVILEAVLEGMAEYYSLQLSENVQRGMRNLAQKGLHGGGGVPYGYKVAPDKHYELDPIASEIVRSIFNDCVAGKTTDEIRDSLNARGIKNGRGNAFCRSNIAHILHNPRYKGIYQFMGVTIEGGMPAIVSQEVWDQAQAQLAHNQKTPVKSWTYSDYLLSGKIVCGECGSPWQGESCTNREGIKYYYYVCGSKKNKNKDVTCSLKRISAYGLDDLVKKKIAELLDNEDTLSFIAERAYSFYAADRSDAAALESVKSQLSENERATRNIMKAIEAGVAIKTFAARLEELEAERENLELSLAQLQALEKLKLTPEMILFYLVKMKENLSGNTESYQQLIHTFIHRILIYKDKIVIEFNFMNPDGGSRQTQEENLAPYEVNIDGESGSSPDQLSPPYETHSNLTFCFRKSYFAIILVRLESEVVR